MQICLRLIPSRLPSHLTLSLYFLAYPRFTKMSIALGSSRRVLRLTFSDLLPGVSPDGSQVVWDLRLPRRDPAHSPVEKLVRRSLRTAVGKYSATGDKRSALDCVLGSILMCANTWDEIEDDALRSAFSSLVGAS